MDKNIFLAWIVLLRTHFKHHSSLHKCRTCRYAFDVWGWARVRIVHMMYLEKIPSWNLLDCQASVCFHRELRVSRLFYDSRRNTGTGWLDDSARFLQWKLRNVFQITRENEWMRAISFCCHIDGMHDGKLRIGVTMYILGKVNGERQLKSAKSFHPYNSTLRVYCFNTAFPRSNCFKKSSC